MIRDRDSRYSGPFDEVFRCEAALTGGVRTRITGGECDITNCPTVYATDRDTLMVQGWMVSDREALAGLDVPDGETVVEVPRTLLEDAVGRRR